MATSINNQGSTTTLQMGDLIVLSLQDDYVWENELMTRSFPFKLQDAAGMRPGDVFAPRAGIVAGLTSYEGIETLVYQSFHCGRYAPAGMEVVLCLEDSLFSVQRYSPWSGHFGLPKRMDSRQFSFDSSFFYGEVSPRKRLGDVLADNPPVVLARIKEEARQQARCNSLQSYGGKGAEDIKFPPDALLLDLYRAARVMGHREVYVPTFYTLRSCILERDGERRRIAARVSLENF